MQFNLFTLAGGAAILYLLVQRTGTAVAERIVLQGGRIRDVKFSVKGITYLVEFDLLNQNPVDVLASGVSGEVRYGSKRISTLSGSGGVSIPSQDTGTIQLQGSIDFALLAANIIDLITGGSLLEELQFVGRITFSNGLFLPINQNLVKIG